MALVSGPDWPFECVRMISNKNDNFNVNMSGLLPN